MVFLAANQQRAYAMTRSPTLEQQLYVIAGNLVAPDSPEDGLARVTALAERHTPKFLSALRDEKRATPETLAQQLAQFGVPAKGSVYVVGYDQGIDLREVSNVSGAVSQILTSYAAHNSGVFISLRDPLLQLANIAARDAKKQPMQFVIVGKEGARALYHPDTKLTLPPEHYRAGNCLSRAKCAITAPYYGKFLDALKTQDLPRANKIVDAFLAEDYCAIDRTLVTIKDGLKRLFAPLIQVPVARTDGETRKQDLLATPSPFASLLVKTHEIRADYRGDIADRLAREYRVACTALRTIPSIVIKGEPKEIEDVARHIRSRPSRHTTAAVASVRPSRIRVVTLPKPKHRRLDTELKLPHVELLNAYAAHKTTRGEGVLGAVMDTGVDYTHPALAARFNDDKGYDFVRNTNDPFDREGHGTHVAGIWAAVAPEVHFRAVRVLDELGRGAEADILLGYEYCYRERIPLVNCSFGATFASEEERRVVEAAAEYGTLIVAAAGNDSDGEASPDMPSFPAAFAGVQSVGSVDKHKNHSWFSNMGYVSFAALGEDVLSTLPGGGFGTMDGTSMAAPSVAGALSLQLSVQPELTLDARVMIAHARCQTEFGNRQGEEWRRRFGYGIPDCAQLVET
jgi:hypothetical protein